MSRLSLSLLLLLCTVFSFSQERILNGKVIDAETNEPLAFVSLLLNGVKAGGYSDIDGKFHLVSTNPVESVHASYVGYETKDYFPGDRNNNLVIRMKRTSIHLPEVIVQPKANPALRIILKTIANKDLNDPEKLKSFSYTSYEKFIFTTNVDSLLKLEGKPGDSAVYKAKQFFGKQDIFIIENIAERKFIFPSKDFQNVLATKVSGFKDPIFVFLLSQLQSNSFYKEVISIGEKNYVNPISKGSTNKYYFQIKDTLYSKNQIDTTFVISFRPFLSKNFDGLKGLLYINTNKYAIENVIASPMRDEAGMSIRIQQMYEKVDSSTWFPVQLNTDINFNNSGLEVGNKEFHIVGVGKSYLKKIRINPELNPREFSEVQIYVEPDATRREQEYWVKYRHDSLSNRDLNTYHFMDSLGNKYNFDKYARGLETIMTGKIPLGPVDIDLNKMFRFNGYEGYYTGLGLFTNDVISAYWWLGGYWGYGFKDKTAKYGAELGLNPDRHKQIRMVFSYVNDVQESGGVIFFEDHQLSVMERLRNFLIDKMDKVEIQSARLSFRALRYCRFNMGFQHEWVTTGFPYYFSSPEVKSDLPIQRYQLSDFITELRFCYKEKFLKNSRTQISMGSDWPVVLLQYSEGISGLLGGEFDYKRVDFKLNKSFFIKYLGKTSFSLTGGFISGQLPVGELYNGNGSFREFTVFSPNSFATMRMNEFISDRYSALYFSHNFGKLLMRWDHFQPEIAITNNLVFGSLGSKHNHHDYTFNTLENGFYESGLLLNNLYSLQFFSLGIGGFYRYGSYSFDNWKDNIAIKFSISAPF